MSEFRAKNFDTLEAGYAHLAAENDRLVAALKELGRKHEYELRALHIKLAEARAVMAPFAEIAAAFPDDTECGIFLSTTERDSAHVLQFSDLARARKFMEKSANA
jgi:hypothetical protein